MSMTVARVAVGALSLAFLWAAGAKITGYTRWRNALTRYRLPDSLVLFAAPIVPVAELSVAVLLISGRSRAGAVLALTLLGIFSLVLSRARGLIGDRLPCGCFGGDGERRFGTLLTRNALLALVAVLVLRAEHDARVLEGLAVPRLTELVPAVLAVIGIVLAIAMIHSITRPRFRGHDT